MEVTLVVKSDPMPSETPFDVVLKGHVSDPDPDLSTTADAAMLEQQKKNRALAICERMGHDYRAATPSTADCAKPAADQALAQAKQVIAAAAKGTK